MIGILSRSGVSGYPRRHFLWSCSCRLTRWQRSLLRLLGDLPEIFQGWRQACQGSLRNIWGFPKTRGTILEVQIKKIIIRWALYWVPLILGNYHIAAVTGSVEQLWRCSKTASKTRYTLGSAGYAVRVEVQTGQGHKVELVRASSELQCAHI